MTSYQDFKKEVDTLGVTPGRWFELYREYKDAIEEARRKHKKRKHLIKEWGMIDAYYEIVYISECIHRYQESLYTR